jgi:hypothetical protein
MKRFGILSTAALLLLLGNTASAYARQEQHEQEAKPEKLIASAPILAASTCSLSANPKWSEDIRAVSTAASGLDLCSRGR